MKTKVIFHMLWCTLLLYILSVAPLAIAAPVGFASMNGGTTGGQGGDTITVTNGADLYEALKEKQDLSTPLIIKIDGKITPGNTGESKIDVKDVEDVSLIGTGNGAEFDGIGIKVTRSRNIIIQNLIIHEVDTGVKDGISIEDESTNIWIDHNEIYASLDVDKDDYDGLLDTKRGSEYITISYNYLHDSWKTSLHGASDSDSGNRYITFHHNHFENLYSRVPLFRFGQGHLYNNYFNNIIDTGINSRMGARLRIENNHFENAKNPVVSFYSDEIGYWDLRDNLLENVTWEERSSEGIIAGESMQSTTSYNLPYSYILDDAGCVRDVVLATAGAGKNLAISDGSCTADTDTGDDDSDTDTDDNSSDDTPPETDGDIVLSPSSSMTLQEAVDSIQAGNTIYLEAGTYSYSSSIIIAEGNNGTADQYKKIAAYGDGQPVLDFSAMSFGSSHRGVILAGNYWRIEGVKIQKAGDNGMLLAGSNNVIDDCEFYANKDTGLQLSRYNSSYDDIRQWPSDNLIQDCYSHSNYDTDDGEDADGFASKLTSGEGNKFIRCVAKYNVDDGWDLYTKTSTGKIGSVYFEDCESSNNGETESGKSTDDSDGNGFKLGGSKISVDHKLVRCKAYDNKKHGITANSNPGNIILIDCDASGNGGEDFKDVSNQ